MNSLRLAASLMMAGLVGAACSSGGNSGGTIACPNGDECPANMFCGQDGYCIPQNAGGGSGFGGVASGGAGNAGGGGVSGGGGSGNVSGGGTGGTGGGAHCAGQSCPDYLVGGVLSVPACCSSNDKCGAELPASVAATLGGVPVGCYEANQPGNLDCDCPAYTFVNPVTQQPAAFPGCCTPSGTCGYLIDTSSAEGPNIGCQEATFGDGQGELCTPGAGQACP